MLKIEKDRRHRFSLRFVPRESMFSKMFWKALGVACLLHGVCFCLFSLKRVEVEHSLERSPFPPTVVEALGSIEVAKIDPLHAFVSPIALPSLSAPQMEPLAFAPPSFEWGASEEKREHSPFSRMERAIVEKKLHAEGPLFLATHVAVLLDERLESFPLVEKSLAVFESLEREGLEKKQLSFNVQLDLHSGELFWFELEDEGFSSLLHLEKALQILRSLRFRSSPEGGIAEGSIEIHFV